MNMHSIGQQILQRLRHVNHDESGVVMIITLGLLLFLVVISSVGFATGNVVTQRMELQNAADAAAFSAAVVQADTLSRVAVINRAMSWTYVMMCRRQMDYACATWLEQTADSFENDLNDMKTKHWSHCCHPSKGKYSGYFCGVDGIYRFVRLNHGYSSYKSDLEAIQEAVRDGKKQLDKEEKEVQLESQNSSKTGTQDTVDNSTVQEGKQEDNERQKAEKQYQEYIDQLSELEQSYKDLGYTGLVSIDVIKAMGNSEQKGNLVKQINKDSQAIQSMNRVEQTLLKRLPSRIESTVQMVLQSSLYQPMGKDGSFDDSSLCYRLEQSTKPLTDYMEIMPNTAANEERFIAFGGFLESPYAISPRGVNVWFNRDGSIERGFRRVYNQAYGGLVSRWYGYYISWRHGRFICFPIACTTHNNEVKGVDCPGLNENKPIVTDGIAQPQILKSSFFGKAGAIVVAVARGAANPFAYQGKDHDRGVFAVYNPGTSHLWAVSAARAGHIKSGGTAQSYSSGWNSETADQKLWNLHEENWDAMFLPVANAWNTCIVKKYPRHREIFSSSSNNALSAIMQPGNWKTLKGDSKNVTFSTYDWNSLSKQLRH